MSSDIAVRADGLSKRYHIYRHPRDRLIQSFLRGRHQLYREFWALQEMSFSIAAGETVGILGRNGAGKSTLLQLICGTLTPTSGSISINGKVAALLELGAGFNPEFSGRENVYLNSAIMGLSPGEIENRIDAIIAFADIGNFIDQPVKTYSTGMTVRLAFSVIAHTDADILVIDEALAVGDAFFTQKCMRFLRDFQRHGTTLLVSHDLNAIAGLCDRAIWIDQAKVRMMGEAKTVCESYLADVVESRQGAPKASTGAPAERISRHGKIMIDQRMKMINASTRRNDLEMFEFRPDAPSFGKGGARIADVNILDENAEPLSWVVGGEIVTFVVAAQALEDIGRPILGFIVKDRLGQGLFSDNTYLTYRDVPVPVRAGEILEARFRFQMPILPAGDYSVTVAIADGTQTDHVQHHWIHDALLFKSLSSSVCTGLVGIPMLHIEMSRVSQ